MVEERTPDPIAANVSVIRDAIERACDRSARDPQSVRLIAAAKMFGADAIARARDAGVPDVGENYVRELRFKRTRVEGVVWHFIGVLQSGTAHRVADLADVVHTVTPGHAAERLARRAASGCRAIPALIEVDLAGRGIGVPPERVGDASDRLNELDGIELIGLMTLPPLPATPEESRPFFVRLREVLEDTSGRHPGMRELSMGMSLDYQVAVEEGATMVRVGSALFGARPAADATGRT